MNRLRGTATALKSAMELMKKNPHELRIYITMNHSQSEEDVALQQQYTDAVNDRLAKLLHDGPAVYCPWWLVVGRKKTKQKRVADGFAQVTDIVVGYRENTYGDMSTVYQLSFNHGAEFVEVHDDGNNAWTQLENKKGDSSKVHAIYYRDLEYVLADLMGEKMHPADRIDRAEKKDPEFASQLRKHMQLRAQQDKQLRDILNAMRWKVAGDKRHLPVQEVSPKDAYITATSYSFACLLKTPSDPIAAAAALDENPEHNQLVQKLVQSAKRLVGHVHHYARGAVDSVIGERSMANDRISATLHFGKTLDVIAACTNHIDRKDVFHVDLAANTIKGNGAHAAETIKTALGQQTSATPMQILVATLMYWAIHSKANVSNVEIYNVGGQNGQDAYMGAAYANNLATYVVDENYSILLVHPFATHLFEQIFTFRVRHMPDHEPDEERVIPSGVV